VQYSAKQCTTVHYSAMHCNAMQYRATRFCLAVPPRSPMTIAVLPRGSLRRIASRFCVSSGSAPRFSLVVPPGLLPRGSASRFRLAVSPRGSASRFRLAVPPCGSASRFRIAVPPRGSASRFCLAVQPLGLEGVGDPSPRSCPSVPRRCSASAFARVPTKCLACVLGPAV
jgi:hypothetical protein